MDERIEAADPARQQRRILVLGLHDQAMARRIDSPWQPGSDGTMSKYRSIASAFWKVRCGADGVQRIRTRIMKIQIRPQGVTLTKTQCVRLERDVDLVLARFGERIDRVIVGISDGDVVGVKCCEIEVRLKAHVVKVEVADTDLFLALEHATERVARSVSRAIETGLVGR